MGDKTKIDWCDATWNPVTGCFHGCEYCYARRIARRFDGGMVEVEIVRPASVAETKDSVRFKRTETHVLKKPMICQNIRNTGVTAVSPYPFGFDPTFHRYKLDEPQHWKKPRNIFVCSMADLFGEWVPDEWIKDVFDVCAAAPQHRYLFLTKNPKRYIDLMKKRIIPNWINTRNMWFGSTATFKKSEVYGDAPERNTFMSIEPIMEPFHNLGGHSCIVDWIIVGAETGNRKGKVIPKKDWIMELSEGCARTHTPIFMKESLREIMGADFRQEFPWGEV